MVLTSGDKEMDRRLGRALLRLAKTFDVNPGCGFFDDGRTPNALAMPKSEIDGTEGTVLFGQNLFRQTMAKNDDGIAVIAVFAHEFAHIAQFKTGMVRTLRAEHRTNKLVELHADFLAGYYLGLRQAEFANLSLWFAGSLIHGLGDNNFTDPNHHGRGEERTAAIEAGYHVGREGASPFARAITTGREFIRRFS
jgi:hypothetical protein